MLSDTDAILMMRPCFCGIMISAAVRHIRKAAFKLVSMTREKICSDMSVAGIISNRPTQFMNPSIRSNLSNVSCSADWHAASSVTSNTREYTLSGSNLDASCCRPSAFLSKTARLHPCRTSSCEIIDPKAPAAPATATTCPRRSNSSDCKRMSSWTRWGGIGDESKKFGDRLHVPPIFASNFKQCRCDLTDRTTANSRHEFGENVTVLLNCRL